MTRRSGVTLVEVLVAIFVMAIGMLSLLVLFPLGALSMAQAIKDDRTAHASANAAALARIWDVRNDSLVAPELGTSPTGVGETTPFGTLFSPDPDGPSYPVYVDPIGMRVLGASGFAPGARLGRLVFPPDTSLNGLGLPVSSLGIQRVNLGFTASPAPPQTAVRWFTMLDDMTFTDQGAAASLSTGEVQRDGRYSWAYLCKRPRTGNASLVDMKVVVYSQRSLQVNATALQPTGERAYRAQFYPFNADGSPRNRVDLRWNMTGEEAPPIRKGAWILDATTDLVPSGLPSPNQFFGTVHGNFYRVVSVTQSLNFPNALELELQTNLKGFPRPLTGTIDQPQPGVVVIMENVAEVFERGTN